MLNISEPSSKIREFFLTQSRLFCLNLSRRWLKSSRNRSRFESTNKAWLETRMQLPECLVGNQTKSSPDLDQGVPNRVRGRPLKPFEECSRRTKNRRARKITAGRTVSEVEYAAKLVSNSPQTSNFSLTPYQALALYLDLDLSERKYKLLRSVVNGMSDTERNIFPSLYTLRQTQNMLLPNIYSTENSAEVELQALLNSTACSITKIVNLQETRELQLICKWGFDGSSGHSQYKQLFSDTSCTDEFLFLVAMVPLRLRDIQTKKDIWVNPSPSSILYCRPLKFIFQKENKELVRNEEQKIMEKINSLDQFDIKFNNGQTCSVVYNMLFTMMDGSVSNILSDTNATSKCIICQATPKQMNLENVDRPSKVENYRFGISTLHCWIRFFECLLHIGYRLPIKTWQVKGTENKKIIEENKKRIQAEFKSKIGLIIDKPKPGYGSSNDGNTARRFFYNPDLSSEITGVDKNLIKKFSLILRILASGRQIDLKKFKNLLDETKNIFLDLYRWYYMPSSVHKILVHGCEIIESFSLPIGQLSEDALEASHKEVRKNRLFHTRKNSRNNSNRDLLKRLLLNSEPLISSKRTVTTHKNNRLDKEVEKYLTSMPSSSIDFDINLEDCVTSSDYSDSD